MSDGKLAVILGGGNGIGESCARLMTERGWRVAVGDLNADSAKSVAEHIGGTGYAMDISDREGLENLAEQIERDLGPVHSLVVSAAMFQERYAPEDFPMDIFRRIMEVNIDGTFNANRIFGTRMAKRGRGSIVNLSSANGHVSNPTHAYGPSKAAVINITRNFAAQWGRSGVRVNSVSPSSVLVPRVLARAPGRYATNIDEHMALGRRIQPMEVAEGVEFLASDRASAITGTDLLIDAGLLAANAWSVYGGLPPAMNEGE